jgi:hypothetical protein
MFTTTALLICLLQAGTSAPPQAAVSTFDSLSSIEDTLATAMAEPRPEQIEEQEFINRFNKLVSALRDFSRNYNSRGTIDVKQVRAVQKAVRELEKSGWFKQTVERRTSP